MNEERMKFFRGFILWQQEVLDIEKHPCLFINFGVNMKFNFDFQMRSVIMILSCEEYPWTLETFNKNIIR